MARIGIIGAGMVGQATGKGLVQFGHQVVFADINPQVADEDAGADTEQPEEDQETEGEPSTVDDDKHDDEESHHEESHHDEEHDD